MDELHQTLARWRSVHTSTTQGAELEELEMLKCDLFTQCDSIESQVEEFQQALCISKLNPERFHLSLDEVHRRQEFVANISQQVSSFPTPLCLRKSELLLPPFISYTSVLLPHPPLCLTTSELLHSPPLCLTTRELLPPHVCPMLYPLHTAA